MKPTTCILAAILTLTPMATTAKNKTVTLRILQTREEHGCFFPYNYIERKHMKGTLARV